MQGKKVCFLSFLKTRTIQISSASRRSGLNPTDSHLEGYKAGGKEIDHSEIMVHGLQEITELLSDFVQYFRPHHGDHYGLLMLVKKNIEVKVEGEIFVHKHKGYIPGGDIGNHARNIQFVTYLHKVRIIISEMQKLVKTA